MANCIYKYKGKDYTKEEFYSLVSNSNFIQQEQAKKFTELQERLNNKEFLEGAKNAFESSEELQRFGTQEQYNDYIARVSLGIVKNPTSSEDNAWSKYILNGFDIPIFENTHADKIKQAINKELPKEIVKAITVVDIVPLDIIGNKNMYLSIKNILNDNGIKDELLINWLGINNSAFKIHPSSIKSEKQILDLIEKKLKEKKKESNYIEFKTNPLALESFNKWIEALEKFPLPFQDVMLSHAIKYVTNPNRRSKYVLQLSKTSLQNAYGIVVNKPHELNRIGKLYDQEVIKGTSDAVGHEPSASGKGYWVHIPRISSSSNNEQYNANIELLRKLSPSTWCTAGGMAPHYVSNYDNYLLIVDGVTVAGIEAFPEEVIPKEEELLKKLSVLNESIANGGTGDVSLQDQIERRDEIQNLLDNKNPKRKVKEVTSRGNNGIASIDHLDDTLAFFEKHNLDTNNSSLRKAIEYKNKNKKDEDLFEIEDAAEHWQEYYDHLDREMRENIDRYNGEFDPEYNNYAYEDEKIARREQVGNITTVEEALDSPLVFYEFNALIPELRSNYDVALQGINFRPYNIAYIDPTLPFYNELAIKAFEEDNFVFQYLSNEAKLLPGLQEQYDARLKMIGLNDEDDLPFSKTKDNLIQGYYDPKNDKVVIVANNTLIGEASKIGIHEVAHRGLLRMAKELGGDKELFKILKNAENELMKKLPELLKRTGHTSLDNLMLDYGFDKNSEDGQFKLLQELSARWAETFVGKEKASWWKELLQSIKTWINKFTGKSLNEEEVNELVGGFVKYGTQNINVPAYDIKKNKEYVFPLQNKEETLELINTLTYTEEEQLALDHLIKLNAPFVSFKESPENVIAFTDKIKTILPLKYLSLSDPMDFDGTYLQELIIHNPTLGDIETTEEYPDPVEVQVQSERDFDLINENNNIFFSTHSIDENTIENDVELNKEAINVMQNILNVEVFDRTTPEGKIASDAELQKHIENYALMPGAQDRVFAFSVLGAHNTLSKVQLLPGFKTVHLYEEFGHLLVHYLDTLTNLGVTNPLHVERLWQKPPAGVTDYLAETDHYINGYAEAYQQKYDQLTYKRQKLKELESRVLNDPGSFTQEELLNVNVMLANNGYVLSDAYILSDVNGRNRIQNDADTLARIEIAGRIVGEALHAAKINDPIKIAAKNKSFAVYIGNIVKDILNMGIKLLNFFRSSANAYKLLQTRTNNLPQDSYSRMAYEIAEGFWNDPARFASRVPRSNVESAEGPTNVFATNDFLESISMETKTKMDTLLNEVTGDIKKQIDDIQEEINKYQMGALFAARNNALPALYFNHKDITAGNMKFSVPQEIMNFLYTQNPDTIKAWKQQADINQAQWLLANPNATSYEIARRNHIHYLDQILSELQKQFDPLLGYDYSILYGDWLNVSIGQLDKLPEPQKTQAKEKFYNQLEMFSNMPGHQNFWDSYEKEYQENMSKEATKNALTIKLKDILRAVNRKNHERALRWYVLGEKLYDANGKATEIPPLFSEIDNLNRRLELKEDRILQKEDILNTLILQNAPQNTITLAQNELAAEYLSNEDYVYLRSKLNHFQKIYDTINAANVNNNIKNLFQFKKDREDFESFLKTGKDSLEGSRFILDKYKNRFVAQSLIKIAENEKGGTALTLDEKLDLLKAAETVPEQLNWFQREMGYELNNDFTWSKIIADIGRIAMQSQQAASDRFKKVEQLIINSANSLKDNSIIKKQLKKTLSNSITELFHEFNEIGKRTHFFINKFYTDKFEKAINNDIERIYNEVNTTLLSEGFTIQLPVGDNAAAKETRANILDFAGGANPYMKNELKRLRDLYNEKMLIHNLTYYEGKPKVERDAIIAQKKLELDPYNFNLWYNSVVKVYYKFVPSTTNAGYQDREEVEYYKGELAIPATRLNDTQIVMADYTKKFKNKVVTLPAVNFINDDFAELYSIPEWKEIYDELATIQEEAYQNYLRKHPMYSYIQSKQSWAFKGDATDRIGRVSQLKARSVQKKLKDDLVDLWEINDEDVVWKTSVNEREIPLRGRIRYDEKVKSSPDVLADNYFVLLKKGWTSANTFVIKKEKQKEIEVLRNIMIERNVKHTDIIEENRSMVSKALKDASKYIRTKLHIDAVSNSDWEDFINAHIDQALYNEDINVDLSKVSRFFFTTLLKINALATKYQISGQWFPAFAAWSQGFYRTIINVSHGRYTNMPAKDLINNFKYVYKTIFDEKMAIRAEYIKGKPISKSSLMMQELGLNGDKVIDRFRLGLGGKLLDDFFGYGNMRLANTGWARTNMRMVLESNKWVDQANTFMNPNQYFDWLKSQNPNITIKDTVDALGNTVKGSMTLHSEIPESKSFWNMYEVYKDINGNNQLRVVPGNENKITPYVKAVAGKYVLNIQNGIDMALGGNSKIMRNPLTRLLFALKKFIVPLLVDSFLSYHDIHKGVYHKSYLGWLKDYGLSVMNSLNFMDQQKQIQGTAYRKAMANDYAAREAFAHIIVTYGISSALNFFKVPIVNMANEECFGPDGDKNSIACKMKLWISINYKRALAEITGLYDPTKWVQNFDKPIAAYDTFMDWMGMSVPVLTSLPVIIYNLITNGDLDEGGKSKGPYKNLNPLEETIIKAVPAFRGIHSVWNVDALINRDQYLTKQLNYNVSLNWLLNLPMTATTDNMWPTEFNTYFDFQKPYPQVRATKPKK